MARVSLATLLSSLVVSLILLSLAPTFLVTGRVCKTKSCRRLAAFLLRQINTSADPCQNFYAHACGKFVADHRLPDLAAMKAAISDDRKPPIGSDVAEDMATEMIKNSTRDAFRELNLDDPNVPNAVKYAKRFFLSCLAWDRNSDESRATVLQFIKDYSKWPLLNPGTWQEAEFEFVETVAKMFSRLSIKTIISLEIDTDKFDNTRKALYLKPASFSFEPGELDETVDAEFMKLYRKSIERGFKTIVDFAATNVLVGAEGLAKAAKDVADFEADLAGHVIPDEMIREDSVAQMKKFYNPYTLKEMDKVYYDKKVWRKFFRVAFRGEPEGVGWLKNKTNTVIVTQEAYFKFLALKYATTPKDTIANYLLWKLIQDQGPLFGENYEDVYAENHSKRNRRSVRRDKPVQKKSRQDCIDEVQSNFPDAVTRVYVSKRFSDKKAAAAASLAEEIVIAARKTFEENEWMSSVAKQRFRDKLDNMVLNVGYPEWIHDTTKLDLIYNKWKFVAENSNYFENTNRFQLWNYKDLLRPADRHEFLDPPTSTGNAHYIPEMNSLTVPAGTFEFPFFDTGFPQAYRFGLLGVIHGHEIFHGFDNEGVLYDAYGSNAASLKAGGAWLLSDSFGKFQNLTRCLVDDFNKVCYDLSALQETTDFVQRDQSFLGDGGGERRTAQSHCIRGDITLAENLADFNGIHVAWKAYLENQRNSSSPETDLRLPGLEQYDMQQLFFLGWSVFWCDSFNPLALKSQVSGLTDTHSPGDARVNQAVKHLRGFASAFNCPPGTPLNPRTVCEVY